MSTGGGILAGMRVVEEGIGADDWVVVNGLQRARPGATVDPKPEGEEAAIWLEQGTFDQGAGWLFLVQVEDTAGVDANDLPFSGTFPYLAAPPSGNP